MFILRYTGASALDASQTDPEASLGGAASSTAIPNRKNNLFGNESYVTLRDHKSEVRGIILSTTVPASDVMIGILMKNPSESRFKVELSFVIPNGNGEIERLMDAQSDPMYSDYEVPKYMEDATDTANMFMLSDAMLTTDRIGIWIKRTMIERYDHNPDQIASLIAAGDVSQVEPDLDEGFSIIVMDSGVAPGTPAAYAVWNDDGHIPTEQEFFAGLVIPITPGQTTISYDLSTLTTDKFIFLAEPIGEPVKTFKFVTTQDAEVLGPQGQFNTRQNLTTLGYYASNAQTSQSQYPVKLKTTSTAP